MIDINPLNKRQVQQLVDSYRAISRFTGRDGAEVWLSDSNIKVRAGDSGGGNIGTNVTPRPNRVSLISAKRLNELIDIHNAARRVHGDDGIEVVAALNKLIFKAGDSGGGILAPELPRAREGDTKWTIFNPELRQALVRMANVWRTAVAQYPMRYHFADGNCLLEAGGAVTRYGDWIIVTEEGGSGCGTWHVTPPVTYSSTTLWDDSGDTNFPEGVYKVTYCEGAFRFQPPDTVTPWCLTTGGHEIRYNGGSDSITVPTHAFFDSQAEVETALSGLQTTFYHEGGTIGYYHIDSNYSDNNDGSPSPTWGLELVEEE